MLTERQQRLKIVEVGKLLYYNNFIAATDGNVSIRLGSDILITPSGLCKGKLTADDMIVVTADGRLKRGKGKSSSEIKMHIEAYRVRDDIKAVVHAHSPYATAFALSGVSMEKPILPELILSLNKVPLANYATPGTKEVADSISELIKFNDGILLENHGVITVATDLEKAYMNIERIEHSAKVLYLSRQLGNQNELTQEQANNLKKSSYQ